MWGDTKNDEERLIKCEKLKHHVFGYVIIDLASNVRILTQREIQVLGKFWFITIILALLTNIILILKQTTITITYIIWLLLLLFVCCRRSILYITFLKVLIIKGISLMITFCNSYDLFETFWLHYNKGRTSLHVRAIRWHFRKRSMEMLKKIFFGLFVLMIFFYDSLITSKAFLISFFLLYFTSSIIIRYSVVSENYKYTHINT